MKRVGLKCPRCRGRLQLVTDGEIEKQYATPFHVIGQPVPTRLEPRPFVACTRCEFCEEVKS